MDALALRFTSGKSMIAKLTRLHKNQDSVKWESAP